MEGQSVTNGEKYLQILKTQLKVTETCQEALEKAFDLILVPEAQNFLNFLNRRNEKLLKAIEAYELDVKNGLNK